MSVAGVCQVCENAVARHTCDNCGALVCTEHYDRATGLCSHCASETRHGSDGPPYRY
ncbi:hypothetical protein [Haloplanus halobius]|uniref:hypothetical protein n=1 Tax=Haloplanus halobius TaxID=2934938 RepID=UPI00200C511E|nr:hypothetical protein [Haloplanus sp. XH21]